MPLSQLLLRGRGDRSPDSVIAEAEKASVFNSEMDDKELNVSEEVFDGWNSHGGVNGGSIAERRAAKCGFDAQRLNTAMFLCTGLSSSGAVCSPYLTIPSGLSPTALLNSSELVSNFQVKIRIYHLFKLQIQSHENIQCSHSFFTLRSFFNLCR